MVVIQKKASDITGAEGAETEFATVIVRQHPKVDQARRLDILPAELADLKEVGDLVVIEVRLPDTSIRELYVRYADFVKWCADEVVHNAPGTRGRVPGSRVGNGV